MLVVDAPCVFVSAILLLAARRWSTRGWGAVIWRFTFGIAGGALILVAGFQCLVAIFIGDSNDTTPAWNMAVRLWIYGIPLLIGLMLLWESRKIGQVNGGLLAERVSETLP